MLLQNRVESSANAHLLLDEIILERFQIIQTYLFHYKWYTMEFPVFHIKKIIPPYEKADFV